MQERGRLYARQFDFNNLALTRKCAFAFSPAHDTVPLRARSIESMVERKLDFSAEVD